MCVYCHMLKKNRVGRSDLLLLFFFIHIFFILKFSEFGFQELLFVIYMCLLTILNTFATVIDEITPFGSRKARTKFLRI